MAKQSQPKKAQRRSRGERGAEARVKLPKLYRKAARLAESEDPSQARKLYERLERVVTDTRLKALVRNDLATLAAMEMDSSRALTQLEEALRIDPMCEAARSNLALLNEARLRRAPCTEPGDHAGSLSATCSDAQRGLKVAILSFLFNWPSNGGGIIHTVELGQFLERAGYTVRHFYAKHLRWGVGSVERPLPINSRPLEFDADTWTLAKIQERFRRAVDDFAPDHVIITDCWNMKPHLAAAMRGYRYFLRFQAQECLCPLNNVRLLLDRPDRFSQCPKHQLATPEACARCLVERGALSGSLHQAERALAGVGTPEYMIALRRALEEAEAVLVLNPLTEALLSPYARRVCVVPWGMDPRRFPWPPPDDAAARMVATLFQAGVVDEPMKGFHVLHAACAQLWRKRQDFRLVATGTPPGQVDPFTHYIGWVSQQELPRRYRETDIVVVPTIAQEGLSRTSVEAMACGRPVLASRIGGLPYTVAEGSTGLLFEPGDVEELSRKLTILLDDPGLRARLGLAGRRRFEEHFTWDVVIDRYYRPLLQPVRSTCL